MSFKKSRIRKTKHLLTNADSSTDAIGGWTKDTPKLDFFEKRKKSSKTQKLKNSRTKNTPKPKFFENGKIIQNLT